MDTIIEDPQVLDEESELLAYSPQPDTGVWDPTKKNNEGEADEDGGVTGPDAPPQTAPPGILY